MSKLLTRATKGRESLSWLTLYGIQSITDWLSHCTGSSPSQHRLTDCHTVRGYSPSQDTAQSSFHTVRGYSHHSTKWLVTLCPVKRQRSEHLCYSFLYFSWTLGRQAIGCCPTGHLHSGWSTLLGKSSLEKPWQQHTELYLLGDSKQADYVDQEHTKSDFKNRQTTAFPEHLRFLP